MLPAYFLYLGLYSFSSLAVFFTFFNNLALSWLSAIAYGNLIFTFNIFLFVVLFSAVSFKALQPKKTFLHRLSLLLAISIKGFNLLVLAYLGMSVLNLGSIPILIGAMIGLTAHVIFFLLYFFFSSDAAGKIVCEERI